MQNLPKCVDKGNRVQTFDWVFIPGTSFWRKLHPGIQEVVTEALRRLKRFWNRRHYWFVADNERQADNALFPRALIQFFRSTCRGVSAVHSSGDHRLPGRHHRRHAASALHHVGILDSGGIKRTSEVRSSFIRSARVSRSGGSLRPSFPRGHTFRPGETASGRRCGRQG